MTHETSGNEMKKLSNLCLVLSAISSSAFAGKPDVVGGLYYSPVQSVPALSEWMLVVLALLLSVIAFRVLKSRTSNIIATLFAVTIVAGGARGG
jgi:hypothetical protein